MAASHIGQRPGSSMLGPTSKLPTPPTPTWVAKALDGDAASMDQLVTLIIPIVQIRAARVLNRYRTQSLNRRLRQELEDLVQQVFTALFAQNARSLREWDPTRGLSLVNYVGFLAEREVTSTLRTRKHNPWTEEPMTDDRLGYLVGSGPCLEKHLESRDLLAHIIEHLWARLSPQGRQFFQLLYVENMSVQAVADQMGTTPDAIYAWRSRLAKSMRSFRQKLEPPENTDHA
ncbi:MAG: hypothetical protein KTR25_18600 [Myxococcales bacterium]|nr:hypothetical protein [Myxococcales bacterium]